MLRNCFKTSLLSCCCSEAVRLSFLTFSILWLQSSLVLANKSPSDDYIKVGFVAFDVGEYRQERSGQIGKVFNQLQSFPDNISIRLIGHSHSKANLASNKLAAIRANSVRDQLSNFGISASSMRIDYDVQNFVATGKLLHGVSVLVLTDIQSHDKVIRQRQTTASKKEETARSLASSVQASPVVKSNIEIEANRDSCNLVSIYSGSLRSNLEREISECGYTLGHWRFGSGDEVIDWHVPVAYNTIIDDGIIGLLQLIEHNYQIRAHIHQLDQSIDFFPSVKDRGGYE